MTTCRSCDAEVMFVPSAKTGKPMILDAKPRKGVVLIRTPGLNGPFDLIAGGDRDAIAKLATASIVDVFTDHHATCPNVGDWR